MRRLFSQTSLVSVALVSGMAAAGAIGWHLGARDAAKSEPAIGAAAVGAGTSAETTRVTRLTQERDTARASIAVLRDRLVQAEQRRADDAADLALYRRLGDESTESGLGIDTVRWRRRDGQSVLDITLVQSKGRSRVSGTLGVSVLAGGQVDGGIELVPDEGELAARFDLRFFQTVSVPFEAAIDADTLTGELAISVRPDGDRHSAFVDIRAPDSTMAPVSGE